MKATVMLLAYVARAAGFIGGRAPPKSGRVDVNMNALVWVTGAGDVRVRDHAGFTVAALQGAVVPCFILDPEVHLQLPPPRLANLHRALCSLQRELDERYDMPLIVRRGSSSELLPSLAREFGATSCHVVSDDVEAAYRRAQTTACAALDEAGVAVERWEYGLRDGDWV